MRYLVLDTCAVIHIIRQDTKGKKCLTWINSLDPQPIQVISVVTKAELINFSIIAGWQTKKIKFLDNFLKGIIYVNILDTNKGLIENYKLIDCYSKNKLPDLNGHYKNGSHIKMGKNDIWIGATALTLNATLLTADKDFDHLNGSIITVQRF